MFSIYRSRDTHWKNDFWLFDVQAWTWWPCDTFVVFGKSMGKSVSQNSLSNNNNNNNNNNLIIEQERYCSTSCWRHDNYLWSILVLWCSFLYCKSMYTKKSAFHSHTKLFHEILQGLDLNWCLSPEVGLPKPDAIFFLDLEPKMARIHEGYGEERYEYEHFQEQVRTYFLEQLDPTWKVFYATCFFFSFFKRNR